MLASDPATCYFLAGHLQQCNLIISICLVSIYIIQFFSVCCISLWIILLNKEFVWTFVLQMRCLALNHWKCYRKSLRGSALSKTRVYQWYKNFKSGWRFASFCMSTDSNYWRKHQERNYAGRPSYQLERVNQWT